MWCESVRTNMWVWWSVGFGVVLCASWENTKTLSPITVVHTWSLPRPLQKMFRILCENHLNVKFVHHGCNIKNVARISFRKLHETGVSQNCQSCL